MNIVTELDKKTKQTIENLGVQLEYKADILNKKETEIEQLKRSSEGLQFSLKQVQEQMMENETKERDIYCKSQELAGKFNYDAL